MLVTESSGGIGAGAATPGGGGGSTPGSATPSLLDSPTLARVERARLRHEAGGSPSPLRAACCQSLTAGGGALSALSALPSLPGLASTPAREMHALKRGLLWQQRDRLFSRWKERYFILTRDYLHCFKRASGSENRISDMGQFIFKVKLVEVERVEWVNRRTYSAVVLTLGRDGRDGRDGRAEGRVLLRASEGLEDWFELLEECTLASKERRQLLRKSHDPNWSRSEHFNNFNNSVTSNVEDWLIARHKMAGLQHLSDSVPDLQHLQSLQALPARARGSHCSAIVGGAAGLGRGGRGPAGLGLGLGLGDLDDDADDDEPWLRRRPPRHEQRLSLLTDIDINSCDMQLETPPPSVPATFRGRPTSYRLNSDVFFMSSPATSRDQERLRGTVTPSIYSSRSVLTPVGSFRSTHLFNPTKQAAERYSAMNEAINYRDRSQSDAHRLERPNWKSKADSNGRRSSCLAQATQV